MSQTPLLNLSHVSVYSKGSILLEDISLSILPRQMLTVIGPNGAGKTTLIKVTLGLCAYHTGTITRMKNLKIGYVPQAVQSITQIPMSVSRFLALHPAFTKESAQQACTLAQLSSSLQNRSMSQLSMGELKRVLLTRALMQQPQLLVLDEPDAGLDLASQLYLYQLLGELRKNTMLSILLISHELHWVMSNTDHAICLSKKICCEGTPALVKVNPSFLKYFPSMAEGIPISF